MLLPGLNDRDRGTDDIHRAGQSLNSGRNIRAPKDLSHKDKELCVKWGVPQGVKQHFGEVFKKFQRILVFQMQRNGHSLQASLYQLLQKIFFAGEIVKQQPLADACLF